MRTMITKVQEATPSRLTAVLRQERILQSGKVIGINQMHYDEPLFASEISYLSLIYSKDTRGLVPNKIVLKV